VTDEHSEPGRSGARVRHALRLVAVLAGGVALGSLLGRYPFSYDITRAQTHTLSAASIAVLEALDTPVTITAYLPPQHPWRAQIEHLVSRYERQHADVTLTIIDPASDPEKVRAEQIREGELLVTSGERTERTGEYTEQAMTETLARLARGADQWIVFVTGHGERSPTRKANHDVSDWARVLEKRGLNVQEINLAEYQIPENTSVLVVASPQLDYAASETDAIAAYVKRGGDLLWFAEPGLPPQLTALAGEIGFEPIPGTVVDPTTLAHGIDNPAFILITRYAQHPALAAFDYTSVMLLAGGLHERPAPGWQATRLIHSSEHAWSETGVLEGNVGYDEGRDYPGPLPLALALTRELAGREQRVAVFGDGDFLANTYLQNSGNQDLGVRIVEWLAREATLVNMPSRAAEDNALRFEHWHELVIGLTFLLGLPAAFALNGAFIWWRRRRA
jgi:ABC-type uncharacterized transport system involved in gliding motility auxiliary subunit